MNTYPKFKTEDVELLKRKTRDDQLKELQYKMEKHDLEKILKSLEIENDYYKKKYKSLDKKKVLLISTEFLIASESAISTSTMSLINPSNGIVLTNSSALLTSPAILIPNENVSKLQLR